MHFLIVRLVLKQKICWPEKIVMHQAVGKVAHVDLSAASSENNDWEQFERETLFYKAEAQRKRFAKEIEDNGLDSETMSFWHQI